MVFSESLSSWSRSLARTAASDPDPRESQKQDHRSDAFPVSGTEFLPRFEIVRDGQDALNLGWFKSLDVGIVRKPLKNMLPTPRPATFNPRVSRKSAT